MPHEESASRPSPTEIADIVRLSREAIVTMKLDGTVTGWNPCAEQMTGYKREEMMGLSFRRLFADDTDDHFSFIFNRIKERENVDDFGMQWLRKDGRPIEVSATFAPISSEQQIPHGILCIAADLTLRNRLARAERDGLFLAAVISSADDAIISVNVAGTITTWNPAAERIFGFKADEVLGKPSSMLIPSFHPDEAPYLMEQLRRGTRIDHFETQRLCKDGKIIDVSLTMSAIKDDAGRLIGASHIIRDVTERRRAEAAERDQLFLASIVSSAEDAIVSKDLNGIVTSWNQAAERILGYTADEMIGKPITTLIPRDQPDEETQILRRIRRGDRLEHYEARRVRKDGRIIQVSLTISPIRDRMGRIVGASKIARDISDRQRWYKAEAAESFLGALVESAEDAIVSKDLNGTVTSWNKGAEVVFGYRADEMIGKPISLLFPPDHQNEEPHILERIRRGERIAHYETQRVRKDGTLIDVSLTVSPIKDRLGRVIGASKIARDITENKRAAAREREILRQAQEARRQADLARQQAEEASHAKDEFLATVSHELRTPITAILGWTRMLVMEQLSGERERKAYEIIDRNARTQAQLIEDLLDVSRIISGKMRVDFKTVDMTGIVTAAIDAVRPTAEAKRIRMTFNYSSDAGPIVGDAQRLQQIVWNLLSNAIKFTPRDGQVQIVLRRVESQVELRVIDNGMGISSRFLPYVFNRFTQADSSTTRTYGGLGMGLAIVKALTELHGGVISVHSEGEGKGAEFILKLPISAMRANLMSNPPVKPSLKPELRRMDDLVGVRLLVVDDEPDTCELLSYVFNECGAIVETAHSVKAALEVFDRWQPDMLISDIGMPSADGYEQ